jgi:ribonuclease-3
MREGELTRVRAALVRRETLARFARQLQLGQFLLLGRGEQESGGRNRPATLCATFEAVVGAIYLDRGIDAVRSFVLPLVTQDLDRVQSQSMGKDPKSRLQEWAQSHTGRAPRYRVVNSTGPDHAKVFATEVTIGQQRCGVGVGRSKQEASQAAAALALERLGLGSPEYRENRELEVSYPISDTIRQDLEEKLTA